MRVKAAALIAFLMLCFLSVAIAQDPIAELRKLAARISAYGYSLRSSSPYVSPSRSAEADRHEFVFARLAYPNCSKSIAGWNNWDVDFPKAERQLIIGLKRLMILDVYDKDRAVRLGQNEISRYPFIYIVEPGYICLQEHHALELREYLQRGGFIFADDFWGSVEWENFLRNFRMVLPTATLREITTDHPIFHQVYDVSEIIQVPNVAQGRSGGPTHEKDGITPQVWGFFDERDRLLVLAMHNTDLGDAWEWAEDPYFPLKYSNYAYRVAINVIVYAMSH